MFSVLSSWPVILSALLMTDVIVPPVVVWVETGWTTGCGRFGSCEAETGVDWGSGTGLLPVILVVGVVAVGVAAVGLGGAVGVRAGGARSPGAFRFSGALRFSGGLRPKILKIGRASCRERV